MKNLIYGIIIHTIVFAIGYYLSGTYLAGFITGVLAVSIEQLITKYRELH